MKKLFLSLLTALLMTGFALAQDAPMVNVNALENGEGTIAEYLTDLVGPEAQCDDASMEGEDTAMFACLLEAVTAAGLAETLMGEGPFTVFAPTDAAFQQFMDDNSIDSTEALLADTETLSGILTYHVVPSGMSLNDISMSAEAGEAMLETVNGAPLTVYLESGSDVAGDEMTVQVGGDLDGNTAYVVGNTINVSNGFIIPIDRVLTPTSDQ